MTTTASPRLFLSADLAAFQPDQSAPLSLWKEVLRVGTYTHPVQGWTLSVDAPRLQRMADTVRAMLSNGVSTDVTVDHSPSARDKYGRVGDVKVVGDRLMLRHDFADDEGMQLAQRAGEVSIELEPEYVDSQGTTYTDAIVASSIVRQPIVTGQSPFVRIAASRGATDAVGLVFRLGARNAPGDGKVAPWVQEQIDIANGIR